VNTGPTIGLLPLFLKLYDDTLPHLREALQPFLAGIVAAIEGEGVDVVPAGVCRLDGECRAAVRAFEERGVDLIVTVHLAYALSLEAAGGLVETALPLLLLDTTMDERFCGDVDPERLLYNHGIHGVQDLASVLRRRGRPFDIVAGYGGDPSVFERVAGHARAARAARALREIRVLRIGEPFAGMGDFDVPADSIEDALGVTITTLPVERLASAVAAVSHRAVEAEVARDRNRFTVEAPDDTHRRSVRVGLGLRRVLEDGGYRALTVNFLAFDRAEEPLDTVPFLEIAKAMERGLGYAGEGDALTAALVGALNQAFGRTTFTEMFCPDWAGGSVFLSHMGEINPAVAAGRPLVCERDFPWTGARNPAVVACAPAPGPAVLANLTPGPDGRFSLIVAPVTVLEDTENPAFRETIRGWIRPACPLPAFLETYSRWGGTHHAALVLGAAAEAVAAFGRQAGLEVKVLGAEGRRS
jgi:L-arabinose isomerase